jgi:fengycin family lipopeptide synthetase D
MDNTLQHKIAIDYWLDKTGRYEPSEIAATTLVIDPAQIQSSQSFALQEETAVILKKICNDKDAGIYIFLLAALNILIYKYTDAEHLLIAAPAPFLANETSEDAPLFLTTVINANADVKQLLSSLQNELKESYHHRAYSFKKFKEKYNVIHGAVASLFNYSFSYAPFTGKNEFGEYSKLSFNIHKTVSSFEIEIKYAHNYAGWFVSRLGEHLMNILSFIATNPTEKIGAIPLLSAEEKKQILETFNDTSVEFAEKDLTIIGLFEKQAQENPAQTAVRFRENDISYETLQLQSLQLAALLRDNGARPKSIVALICDRSQHMIIGMLGVLKAGAAYLPIDADIPDERIDYILQDSSTQIILTTREVFNSKPELFNKYQKKIVLLDNITGTTTADFTVNNTPDDPAYIIYTSGSTGRPKGITILHKGFINLVLAFKSIYASGFNTTDRCLALANIAFDASVGEIYMALTSGSTLVILDKEHLFDTSKLAEFIVREAITFAYVPPVLLKDLHNSLKQYRTAIKLNKLFVGVEAIKDTLLYDYCELIKDIDIVNAYGPTETTVICSGFNYKSETPTGENVSIGGPIPNYRIYILNNLLELLPVGVVGEVCVAGVGVSQGYLNNEELSAIKFVDDPFYKDQKMYKTGDLAKWTPEGNIVFIGRKDNQVKIRGYRVELGEIESVLLNHPQIKEAVVCAFDDEMGSKYLCAYFVPLSPVTVSELRTYLAKLLPEYMVPPRFMAIEQIPVTSNGKTDRRKLPRPENIERIIDEGDKPSSELEEKLIIIWKELLNVPQIGVNDNFFELGGHSLKAAKLITIILRDFKVEVPLRQVFSSGSVKRLAEYVQKAEKTVQFQITTAPALEHYPASFAQRRLYLSYLLNKEVTNYNMPLVYELKGTIDITRFGKTFTKIIERQEALRTGFAVIDGVVVQRIYEKVSFEVSVIQSTGAAIDKQIADLIRPFDLSYPPLLRISIIQQGLDDSILFIDMHHIISDGVSIGLLLTEFTKIYNAETLSPLKIQYKDYAFWLDQYRATAAFNKQKKYWLTAFADKQEALELPLDYPRPNESTYEGENIVFTIDKTTVLALRKVANDKASTLFLLTFAAYKVLLYKYSGQNDIVVGTPVVGRIHPDLDDIVGMFVNTLPVRTNVQSAQSFTDLLAQLKENFFKALDNQLYPFEELIENINLERTGSRNPLFDTLFAYQNLELEEMQIGGLSVKAMDVDNTAAKFDLSIEVQEVGEELVVVFNFSKELFRRSTIERMGRHYLSILTEVVQSPEKTTGNICLINQDEKEQLLSVFNNTKKEILHYTIHQLFEEQVGKAPGSIAISGNDTVLTYTELNKRADDLAAVLINNGLKKGDVVAVLAVRNERLIISLLAILKAGGVYLPVDPNHPLDRIAFMFEDTSCLYVLKTGNIEQPIARLIAEKQIRVLDTDVKIDGAKPMLPQVGAKDSAYIIYTSGSTGKPKGVIVEHGSIVNYISWANRYYLKGQRSNMPLFTSIAFDLTLTAIFTPLATGNEIVIYNEGEEGLLIEKIITENRVDVIKLTPAHLNILNNIEPFPIPQNNRIRTLIVGGEALDSRLAADIYHKFENNIEIFNEYGPTEATVGCMIYKFDPEDIFPAVPIGKPIDNTRIYLLDSDDQVCPPGITGEICIAGDGLARGYLNRPELTSEKFTTVAILPNERIYRSGDLGKWLSDGDMIFVGRKDEQLKINGYRIEPGEIKATLLRHKAIKQAVVIPFENKPGSKVLAAYFVSDQPIDDSLLKTFLTGQLPFFMVPAYFIQVNAFTLTSNGKINKKALPKPNVVNNDAAIVLPENEMEAKLLEVWKDVLEINETGITHNFFESGGHSLKALVLVSRIQKIFHTEVFLKDVFNNPTVKMLAHYLSNASRYHFASIAKIAKQANYPLSSAQKRIFVMSHFKGAETSYNMYAAFWVDGNLDISKLENSFQSLINRHESLRTSFSIVNDEPVQIVHDHIAFQLNNIKSNEEDIEILIKKFIRKFEIAEAPLFRAQVVDVSAERHLIMFDMHHIIADGVSLDVFFNELWQIYNGHQFPELAIQYKDYAAWQQSFFTTGAIEPQKQFWKKQFEGTLPQLDLPTDFPRPLVQTFEGRNYQFDLDSYTVSRISAFISEKKVTLNMFMLAVYNILLSKYTSQEDIIVGTPVAGRTHADLEPVIGMFVNTLALRNYPSAGKTFEQFLDDVKTNALSAYENQDYPFEELVESLQLKRDTSRNPLFDTMFLFMSPKHEQEEQVLKFTAYPLNVTVAKFDLTFETIQLPEKIKLLVNYNTALFAAASIERLVVHFTNIIDQVLESPAALLQQIVLPDQQELQLLKAFGGTAAKALQQSIPGLWSEQVSKYKKRIAVETTHDHLTFEELDHQSSELAAYLKEVYALKTGDKVALMLQRTLSLPIALLAILKAGAIYIPIDPFFPAQRINYILDNSESRLIITDKEVDYTIPVFNIRVERKKIANSQLLNTVINTTDIAYITYTSGSTGAPKGVMIEHGNVVSFTQNLESVFGINAEDKILAITNITFDISVLEILCSLMAGVSVVLADDMEVNDFEKIAAVIADKQINILQLTPSRFSLLLNTIGSRFMLGVKTLLIGGEAMPAELFHTLKSFNKTRIFNVYGPTETCIWSTADEIKDDKITIGKPLLGEQVLILGTHGHLQPINVTGEVCITGSGVGKGYFKNDDLTTEKFFKDEQLSTTRIYRTGDIGRWLPDGRIGYIGRIDNQVKLRGYRIELGEIENALRKFEGVKAAAAILSEINREKQIIAFYEGIIEHDNLEIRTFLANYLPHYMLPDFCVYLAEIPLTSSGKIDRKALEPMAQKQSPSLRIYEEAVGEIQKNLVSIWEEILNVKPIGVSTNFFETGGNSIKLIQVLNRVKRELDVDLPLATAFKYATIKELAEHIRTTEALGKMYEELPYSIVNPGKQQVIFCFPPFIGYSFLYAVLADHLPDYTLCCFHFTEGDDRMERYIQIINEMQPNQPLVLLGYSIGGNFAFEVAKELELKGQEVSDIILIDSYKRWKADGKSDEELENDVALQMQNIDLSVFDMDIEYVKTVQERAQSKMLIYSKFMNDKIDTDQINARIHLIKCDEKLDTPVKNRNWEDSTNNDCFVYQGNGAHPVMLAPEYLSDNVIHLLTIMQQVKMQYI